MTETELQADNVRLRGLIAYAERLGCCCTASTEPSGCPWCGAVPLDYDTPVEHAADCKAFEGPGKVR